MNYCALNTQCFPGIYTFWISFPNEKKGENVLMTTFLKFAAASTTLWENRQALQENSLSWR